MFKFGRLLELFLSSKKQRAFLSFFRELMSLPVGYFLEGVWTANELVQGFDNADKCWTVWPLLLPAVQHELVYGFWAVHWRRKTVALLDGLDNVLIGPRPIRTFSVWHHLQAPRHYNVSGNSVRKITYYIRNNFWIICAPMKGLISGSLSKQFKKNDDIPVPDWR